MAHLFHCLEIKAHPSEVYKQIKDLEGVKSWWTKDAELINEQVETYHFKFHTGAQNKMQVLEKVEDRFIHWRCIDGHQEWINTEISFELEQSKENTILCFKHFNWKEESNFLGTCNHFWAFYLDKLKTNISL